MKTLSTLATQTWAGLRVLLLMTLVLGVAYPLVMTGVAALLGDHS